MNPQMSAPTRGMPKREKSKIPFQRKNFKPLSLSLSLSLSHTDTLYLTHSLIHSLALTHTHTHTHTHTRTHTHKLARLLAHSLTHSHTHTHTIIFTSDGVSHMPVFAGVIPQPMPSIATTAWERRPRYHQRSFPQNFLQSSTTGNDTR